MGDYERENKEFLKYKCKLLNQEDNEKYRELMIKYLDLQTKGDDIKAELSQMNNVAFNLCLEAGVETSKAPVNMQNLANIHK